MVVAEPIGNVDAVQGAKRLAAEGQWKQAEAKVFVVNVKVAQSCPPKKYWFTKALRCTGTPLDTSVKSLEISLPQRGTESS
jgi:hypothetical protein